MSEENQGDGRDHGVEHDLDGSFKLLAGVVAARYAARQRSLGAALKPLLKSESYGRFSEEALGFPRFGDFLREAQRRTVISLHRDTSSPDLEITPFDEPPLASVGPSEAGVAPEPATPPQLVAAIKAGSSAARAGSGAPGGRIRRDLWNSFMDWRQGQLRVYDRRAGAATLLPLEPLSLEPPEFAELRERLRGDADGLVTIEPIAMADQLRWMQEFAATRTEPDQKAILGFSLSHGRPLQEFARATRSDPQLERAWLADRTARVAETIARWAEENDVDVNMWSRSEPQRTRPPRNARARAVHATASEERLRALVHRAVDRMPASELMRLSLPVEFMVEAE